MIWLALYLTVPLAIVLLVQLECFGWSTLAVLGALAGLYFLHSTEAVNLLRTHGLWLPLYALGYLALGTVWSFVKWWSFLMDFRRAFRAARDEFLAARGAEYRVEELQDFLRYHDVSKGRYGSSIARLRKPVAQDNKGRIVAWTAFWPFSFVGTVLDDPVRRLCEVSFDWFKGLYQRLVDRLFQDETELH